jgi:hypothetical protein
MVSTRQVEGARRGARVKALAIASKYPWVHIFKPALLLALDMFFQNPSIDVLKELYLSIVSIDFYSVPCLTISEKKVIRSFCRKKIPHYDPGFTRSMAKLKYFLPAALPFYITLHPAESEVILKYNGLKMPLKIPAVSYDSEFGDFSISAFIQFMSTVQISNQVSSTKYKDGTPFVWHPHLDIGANTNPFLILLFGLLTEKKIVFVGNQKPCSEISNFVLSCIAIAAAGDLLPNVFERCFPYASLATVETLISTPGYIAGASNPVFEEQPAWWDICINLNTKKLTISSYLIKSVSAGNDTKSEYATMNCKEDEELIDEVLNE